MLKLLLTLAFLTGLAAAQSFPVNPAEFLCTTDSLAIAPGVANLADGTHSVNLSWTAPTGEPSGYVVAWYRVYRGTVSSGPYTLLADCVTATSYTDSTVLDTTTYYYVTTAMTVTNGTGISESPYSNQSVAAIPVQDAIAVQFTAGAILTESLTTTDTLARKTIAQRPLSETLTTSDTLARLAAFQRSLGETLTTGDTLAVTVPGSTPFTAALSDTLSTSDVIQRMTVASRLLADTLSTSEALTVPAPSHVLGWSGTSTASGTAIYSSGAGVIPPTLFGLHFRFNEIVQLSGQPCPATVLKYPNIPFGALRLWDTDTRWQNLNPSSGVFTFTCLDPYLALARTFNLGDLILTLSATPQWAASNETVTSCDYSFFTPGDCSPPADLNSDGTGTNQHWRDYIYALGTHIAGLATSTYMAPTYFELWNEFTRGSGTTTCTESAGTQAWLGTCTQMVRLAQDANCILTGRAITITATSQTCNAAGMNEPAVGLLPNSRILTPNAGTEPPDINLWGTYLATAGALTNVDKLAVHAYAYQGLGTTTPCGSSIAGSASGIPQQWTNTVGALPTNGAAFGLTTFSSEGSWASTPLNLPDPNMDEGYVASYYLCGWSSGFREMYWYAVNNSYGTLINQNLVNGCNDGGTQLGCPTLAATGWTAIYNWMVGSVMTVPCTVDSTGNIWACGLQTAGGVNELAVWDASQTCTPCTYSSYSYPSTFTKYYTLDSGSVSTPLAGGMVNIGWKPILLSQ
jgi:hypothetical protein